MSDSEADAELRRWMRYAQDDLETAKILAQNPSVPPRQTCFHAQQSAEKAIKAIFVYLQVEFPFRHDLELLLALVPDDWQLKHDHPDLSQLSDWAVDARYPETPEEATTDDALNSIQTAQTVFDVVTADLRQRGFEYEAE